MEGFLTGKLMRIFVDDADRVGLQPVYEAVIELLRSHGISGATVFRGVEGYSGRQAVHRSGIFSWYPNLPILIEVIDDEVKLAGLLPELRALLPSGLIAFEQIEYQRVGAGVARG
jgi:PII-like signaling protein